ncbi:MAG: hypothetical protein ACK5L7_00740 [Paludibacteraceae bacterium]
MKFFRISFLFLIILAWGCTKVAPKYEKTPLLEVEGKYLYYDELKNFIPTTANKIDSSEIAQRFIRLWVTQVLMYKNGERNLKSEDEINQQVEEYRKALVIHQYEQALIQERVSDEVSDEEMKQFYDMYSKQLSAPDNLIKGILLILPKTAPKMMQVREWVRIPSDENLEKIEKYSLKNAISFDYLTATWTPLSEILKKAPFKIENSREFVTQIPFAETSDSANVYMLRITNAVAVGDTEPYELAKEKIKTIILNKRQSDFILQFEKDIYNDAVNGGKVVYLNKKQ